MIKGRDGKRGSSSSGYSADLLVCFPSRAHLALTPKPISSPSRPYHRRQLSKLSASRKNMGVDELVNEPTSPKVTCAGQIKVRPSKCGEKGKNWQSVMEEIERIHVNRSQSKFLALKKDVIGFLTCLKNIRFGFRCFGDFHITSDDDEEEEEENSEKVFSKWFMVLQEEQINDKKCVVEDKRNPIKADAEQAVPPPNALLLMRCRSAPAKSWLEERMELEKEEEDQEDKRKKKDLRSLMEEEKMELVLMRYDTDYYKLSCDIARETWVVGGIQDSLSRSRSLKS